MVPPKAGLKPALAPQRWRPPTDTGLTGRFSVTATPAGIQLWRVPGIGPEDVVVDPTGAVFTGIEGGPVLRLTDLGRTITQVADTGARPAGIELGPDGSLIVCDSHRGLLQVDPATSKVRTLVSEVAGTALVFTNNCSVAGDGTVYFSDSSRKFPIEHFKGDLIEGRATGRLLRWTHDEGVEVILDGLRFANGVALSEDDSYLLVAETAGYGIRKVALTGPRAGQSEYLFENLPGSPDNISLGSDGIFWVAMPSTRNALLDRLLPAPGAIRRAVWALPEKLSPQAAPVLFVLGITGAGEVRHVVFAEGEVYKFVTGVREHDGWLYLGSLTEDSVARFPKPA